MYSVGVWQPHECVWQTMSGHDPAPLVEPLLFAKREGKRRKVVKLWKKKKKSERR